MLDLFLDNISCLSLISFRIGEDGTFPFIHDLPQHIAPPKLIFLLFTMPSPQPQNGIALKLVENSTFPTSLHISISICAVGNGEHIR